MLEALEIPVPEDPSLVLDGCRRLLGPNLYGTETGAVGDAVVTDTAPERVLALWSKYLQTLLDAMGWAESSLVGRTYQGGCNLYVSASVDQLYTAAYVIEAAWYFCTSELLSLPSRPVADMVDDLVRVAEQEANAPFRALAAAAAARGIDRLLDNDKFTLGHGAGSQTWSTESLPQSPDWSLLHDIPVALVTGTNGKTTTTRLIAAIGRAAGKVSGLSSTEFVKVGDDILDKGDYSGPAGARLLLRDPRLEIGVLEVARGGILRRGLPITRARAAVVTNVASDHLGQYGIMTVPELAEVKLAVHRGLAPEGLLILNADDPQVVETARSVRAHTAWFSLDPAKAQITAARAANRPCGWLENGQILLSDGATDVALIAAADVPLTLGGVARYNIENALAAALAARALGIPDAAIREVLATFRSDARDNPGRANEFAVNGARLFVDFAHNPHSIAAVTSALAAVPAKRRFILLSHAGDRSNDDITGLVKGAFALGPDYVVVAENPKYLRGRPLGDLPALMRAVSLGQGLPADHILMATSPYEGARQIIERLEPGDLALLLVHDDRQKIFDLLASQQAARAT
jgi:cyanophycin synthetase